MQYSFIKIFAVGVHFFALTAPSPLEAFSPVSIFREHNTLRIATHLMYRKQNQTDTVPLTLSSPNTQLVTPEKVTTKRLVKTEASHLKLKRPRKSSQDDVARTNLSPKFLPTPLVAPKKTKHLVKVDFDEDMSKDFDVTRPYYNLENEHAIIDDTTNGYCGFCCTVKKDTPIGRETGEVSLFSFLRSAGCVNSAAAFFANPAKKSHFYPASDYTVSVNPSHDKRFEREVSCISNSKDIFDGPSSDPVFMWMLSDMSKRSGTYIGLLKTEDTVWCITGSYFIIPTILFKKRYPAPAIPPKKLHSFADPQIYENLSSKLQNLTSYSSLYHDWVCLEGSLPPCEVEDCAGHFRDYPCLPHSSMVFHSCDLIGMAIEELTGLHIPFKQNDFGNENALEVLNFDCSPQNLHFPNTYGLKFMTKVYCSSGEEGLPGSTYVVETSAVQDVSGVVCFTATGRFVLRRHSFDEANKN